MGRVRGRPTADPRDGSQPEYLRPEGEGEEEGGAHRVPGAS